MPTVPDAPATRTLADQARALGGRTLEPGERQRSVNRQTGTLVSVYKVGEGGPPAMSRWTTLCHDHNVVGYYDSAERARFAATTPDDWCGQCREIERARRRERT